MRIILLLVALAPCAHAGDGSIFVCTALYWIPDWLSNKYSEYISYVIKHWDLKPEIDYISAKYNNENMTTFSGNEYHEFWREKFYLPPRSYETYFLSLRTIHANAMFNRHILLRALDLKSLLIEPADRQLIRDGSLFPSGFGEKKECLIGDDVTPINIKLWPTTEIPVYLSKLLPYSIKKLIQEILSTIEFLTCLRFVPVKWQSTKPLHFLYIETNKTISMANSSDMCFSEIYGYSEGTLKGFLNYENHLNLFTSQQITLNEPLCMSVATITANIMKSLGVIPEHQRFDRDIYLNVNYENIDANDYKYFEKYFTDAIPYTPYKYTSSLHSYSRYKANKYTFAVTRKIDNTPIDEIDNQLVANIFDFNRLNFMYKCTRNTTKSYPNQFRFIDFNGPYG